ncbi:MAG TPA: type II toxin-antitoxin system VapC family toxin [Terricaulis sp.]|nr:type II toxin-antitoxin system VapC family toxin [Terricaulis sp.]
MSTFIDTNVLLDVATNDPHWANWSIQQLEAAALGGPLIINDVVYAELSVRYGRVEDCDAFIAAAGLKHEQTPRAALFLAAKAFQRYRAAGGVRTGVLPDFFIGAHASVAGLTLLTRDAQRYRGYFPKLKLISP